MIYQLSVLTFLVASTSYPSNNCFQGCYSCQIIFIYIYCTQCYQPRIYNTLTGDCDCPWNMYQQGNGCNYCPSNCLTCDDNARCMTCASDKYLSLGSCVCSNGNSIDSSGNCAQSSSNINVGLVLGLSIGGGAAVICIIAAICIYNKRKMQIFDSNQGRSQINNEELMNRIREQRERDAELSANNLILQNKYLMNSKKNQYKEQVCSICLDHNTYYMTVCGHYFHQNCIFSWLRKRNTCPNCNCQIQKMSVMKWCSICKHQLIFPHPVRFNTSSKHIKKPSMVQTPAFAPTCANCDNIDESISLK